MEPLWAELINSNRHDYLGRGRQEDYLANPDWLTRFVAAWNLPAFDVKSPHTRRKLDGLRTLLARLAQMLHDGKPLSNRDVSDLNAYLAQEPVVRRLSRDGEGYALQSVPTKRGLNAALAEIATTFADMVASGDPTRIRVCENPDCRWIIYDQSKNRSRRWCEGPTGCGNLIKVRRHRARKRRQAAAKKKSNESQA